MSYRIPYKRYMDKIQDACNELGKIHGDMAREGSEEAKAIRGVIDQIGVINDALKTLFDRLEPANKYYGREGEIKE